MLQSNYYDIDLIDVNENVENFTFERVPKKCLETLLERYKDNKPFLEFSCSQGQIILDRKYIRGIMYVPHFEKQKTVAEETFESAEEIAKIAIVKKANKPKVVAKE